MNLQEYPHTRFNPLTGEWILVSPHRTKRPWQGKIEKPSMDLGDRYDPHCYLCPGNERAGGIKNPRYKDTFVFINDFSALLENIPKFFSDESGLIRAESERGTCKVVCFSPIHNLTLALMDIASIKNVIDVWVDEYRDISKSPFINYIQIFENHGAMMGCSNPHPHCQIWANEKIPAIPSKEDYCQNEYHRKNNSCLLCDYIKTELERQERIIFENDSFIVLVPFWAVWPFETMIIPKSHSAGIDEMSDKGTLDLADALRRMGIRFDNLFKTNFPYSMGIHQKPVDSHDYQYWHFHIHYYPPLLRSSTIQKFMVGYELLANPQRDITAEKSAELLKSQEETHFRTNSKQDEY